MFWFNDDRRTKVKKKKGYSYTYWKPKYSYDFNTKLEDYKILGLPSLSARYVDQMASMIGSKFNIKVFSSGEWKVNMQTKELHYNPDDLVFGTKANLIASILHEVGHLVHSSEPSQMKSPYLDKYKTAFVVLNAYEDIRIDSIMSQTFPSAEEIYKGNIPAIKDIAKNFKRTSEFIKDKFYQKLLSVQNNLETIIANKGMTIELKINAVQTITKTKLTPANFHEESRKILEELKRINANPEQSLTLYDYLMEVLINAYGIADKTGIFSSAFWSERYFNSEYWLPHKVKLRKLIRKAKPAIRQIAKAQSTQEVADILTASVFPDIEFLLEELQEGKKRPSFSSTPMKVQGQGAGGSSGQTQKGELGGREEEEEEEEEQGEEEGEEEKESKKQEKEQEKEDEKTPEPEVPEPSDSLSKKLGSDLMNEIAQRSHDINSQVKDIAYEELRDLMSEKEIEKLKERLVEDLMVARGQVGKNYEPRMAVKINTAGLGGLRATWLTGDYAPLRDSVEPQIKQLKKKLRAIRTEDLALSWVGEQKRGKVNNKSLYRYANNDFRMFKKLLEREDTIKNYAFSIIADISGSMETYHLTHQARGITAMSEIFQEFEIPFEVLAFDDKGETLKDMDKELDQKAKAKIAGMPRIRDGGGTRLASGLKLSKLYKRSEKNKLMIILSDGDLGDVQESNDFIRKFKKDNEGFKTIGVSFMAGQGIIKFCDNNGELIKDMADFPDVFTRLVKKNLKKDKKSRI